MYKKSTFTSSGNLLLSSKYQSLLTLVEWKTKRKGTYNSEFKIRKKSFSDILKVQLMQSLTKMEISDSYVLHSKGNLPKLLYQLIEILKPLFVSKEIYKIEHTNNVLRIELRSEYHHFDILDRLIEL